MKYKLYYTLQSSKKSVFRIPWLYRIPPVSIISFSIVKHVSPLSVLNGHCDAGLWPPITAPQRKDHFDMWANLWLWGPHARGGRGWGFWWTVSKRGCYLDRVRDTSFNDDKSLRGSFQGPWASVLEAPSSSLCCATVGSRKLDRRGLRCGCRAYVRAVDSLTSLNSTQRSPSPYNRIVKYNFRLF